MIYLATPSTPKIAAAMKAGLLGQLLTPDVGNVALEDVTLGVDNGCFPYRDNPDEWPPEPWIRALERAPRASRFAVVADVVFDHVRTVDRWREWSPIVRDLGHRPAFAVQNGIVDVARDVPDDAEAIFVGGDNRLKYGPEAIAASHVARDRGLWLHLGRVNSLRRLRWAFALRCDSVDGTFLTRAPDKNLPRLLRYLEWGREHPLFEASGEAWSS